MDESFDPYEPLNPYTQPTPPPPPPESGGVLDFLRTLVTVSPSAWRWPERTQSQVPLEWSDRDPVKQWANWRLGQVPQHPIWDPMTQEIPESMRQEIVGGGPIGTNAPGSVAGITLPRLRASPLTAKMGMADVPRYPEPDVPTIKKYFELGAKDPANLNWYTEGQKAGEMLAGPEEPLLRFYGAVFSQRKGPVPETNLAMKAYRAYKEGGVEAIRTLAGPSTHQRQELIEGTLRFENNPFSNLLGAFTPGSMKRRDYYKARGSEDVSVIDTHAGNVATRGEFQPDDPRHYFGVQQIYHDLAQQAGVPRKGYQAAVWVPWRAEQAALRGVPAGDPSPAAHILMKRAETNPDWQALVRQGRASAPPPDWRRALLWSLLGVTGAGAGAGAMIPGGSYAESDMPPVSP